MKTSVFITNLEAYNNGRLVGEWVELPFTDEQWGEIYQAIGEPEEMFITDCETDFSIGEFESIFELNEFVKTIGEDYDENEIAALFEAGYSRQDIIDGIGDSVIFYPNMTLEDVAYELVDECYDLPEFAKRYFDYEAFARDLEFDGYTETSYGVICA